MVTQERAKTWFKTGLLQTLQSTQGDERGQRQVDLVERPGERIVRLHREFDGWEVESVMAHDAGDGLHGLEERVVALHLVEGAEGNDVVLEEGALAGGVAIGAQGIAVGRPAGRPG